MTFQDLRRIALLAGLGDDQVAQLADAGEELGFEEGERLFEEGRPAEHWWLLLDGEISLVRRIGAQDSVLGALQTPGQWAGGFRAWDEHGVYMATGRGSRPGRVFRLPADRLHALADEWFPLGVHLLRGLMGTARRVESNARQREALVALGTLAAGLAHEINNPASAAVRAAGALQESCDTLLDSLGQMAGEAISASQFGALDELRRAVDPAAAPTGVALAAREEALGDWLDRHGIGEDWLMVPALAAAGADVDWCERAAGVLGEGPALRAGLLWVASAFATTTLISEVRDSTRRISELVAAVKSYSQMDRGAVQRIDVTEGLDSTLVMMGHRMGPGVSVVREYGEMPLIEAAPGELNQVWTNLVDNAIDAMEGSGDLRISTRADDHGVVVEIADTGHGMPPEVAAHAFEPFFTTKDVGKGTGLGLDISRRIVVERHGGEITIDSHPGNTVIRVWLPLSGTR